MRENSRSIDEPSSFDNVLSRLEKITQRVQLSRSDANQDQVIDRRNPVEDRGRCDAPTCEVDERESCECQDGSLHGRPRRDDYIKSLEALANRVKGPSAKAVKKKSAAARVPSILLPAKYFPRSEVRHFSSRRESSDCSNDIIWRAYAATKSFGAIVYGVVATQALVRKWLTIKCVEKMKRDIQLQNAVNSTLLAAMKRFHHDPEYNVAIKEVTVCQSLIERYVEKVRMPRQDLVVVVVIAIQAIWRAFASQKMFQGLGGKAEYCCLLNKRAVEEMKMRQETVLKERKAREEAAVKIATHMRKSICQNAFRRSIKDIITCQSLVRRFLLSREAEALKHRRSLHAAKLIDTRLRGFVARRTFLRTRTRVILAQSTIRSWKAAACYAEAKSAVTKIASAVRSYNQRNTYKSCCQKVIICQSVFRRIIAIKMLQSPRHERRLAAATFIQSQVRMYFQRKQFERTIAAAVELQSIVRMNYAAAKFSHTKTAATAIASKWRSYQTYRSFTDIQRKVVIAQTVYHRMMAKKYLQVRKMAVTKISAAWRRHEAMVHFALSVKAATKITSSLRRCYFQSTYNQLIKDVIICQSITRRGLALKHALLLRHEYHEETATTIQAMWRARVAFKCFERWKIAATKITSMWRCHWFKIMYKKDFSDVIACQSFIRRKLAARKMEHLRFELYVAAAIKVQGNWRAFTDRQHFSEMKHRVVLLQSVARKWIAKRCYRHILSDVILGNSLSTRNNHSRSATAIGSKWRSFRWKVAYEQLREDVSMCQSAVRQYLAMRKLEDLRHRRNEACATMVEAQWRCFTVRREFVKTVAKVVYLQSILRRWRSEKTRARLITAAIVCQSVARRCLATYQLKLLRHQCNMMSATLIQTRLRTLKASTYFKHVILSVKYLQAIIRKYQAMKILRECKQASICIAAYWRRHSKQTCYRRIISAAVSCQSFQRSNMARRKTAALRYNRQTLSSTKIQAQWRTYSSMNRLKNIISAFIATQARFRMIQAMKHFRTAKHKATRIQMAVRKWQAIKILQEYKQATTNISACWRRHHKQAVYKKTISDVIMCQSVLRLISATKEANRLRQELRSASATKLQARWRLFAATKRFGYARQQVTLIQSLARRLSVMIYLKEHKRHSTIIQARWRCFSDQGRFTRIVTKIIHVQSVIRAWGARLHCIIVMRDVIICQSIIRRKLAIKRFRLMVSAHFIEQQWISFLNGKKFVQIRPHVAFIATIPGAWIVLQNNAATKMTTSWRRHHCLAVYQSTLRGVVICQEIVRRYLAMKKLETDRITSAAVTIQVKWATFHAARRASEDLKEKRLNSAATTIQAHWRGFAKMEMYTVLRSYVVFAQSIIRMNLAIVRRRMMTTRLVRAANYHSDDYFAYSKKRKAAAIKIQTAYRRRSAMAKFIASLQEALTAAIKIQSTYRMHSIAKFFQYELKQNFRTRSHTNDISAQELRLSHTNPLDYFMRLGASCFNPVGFADDYVIESAKLLDCQCGVHWAEDKAANKAVCMLMDDKEVDEDMTGDEVSELVKNAIRNARKAVDSSSEDISISIDESTSTRSFDGCISLSNDVSSEERLALANGSLATQL